MLCTSTWYKCTNYNGVGFACNHHSTLSVIPSRHAGKEADNDEFDEASGSMRAHNDWWSVRDAHKQSIVPCVLHAGVMSWLVDYHKSMKICDDWIACCDAKNKSDVTKRYARARIVHGKMLGVKRREERRVMRLYACMCKRMAQYKVARRQRSVAWACCGCVRHYKHQRNGYESFVQSPA